MKRIAPEVDQLLWRVAEEGDPKAISDFQDRFPDLRGELTKRLSMVQGLRQGKRVAIAARLDMPVFRPRVAPPTPAPMRVMWVAAVLVLATLGLASYVVTSSLTPQQKDPAPLATNGSKAPINSVQPDNTPDNPIVTPQIVDDTPPPIKEEPPATLALWDKPQTFKFNDTQLSQALLLVGQLGGLNIEIAPNFPSTRITKNYEGWTAINVLNDLSKQYKFSFFQQEPGKVLALPAENTDPTAAETAPDLGEQMKVTKNQLDPR